jgi:hypothetical protein
MNVQPTTDPLFALQTQRLPALDVPHPRQPDAIMQEIWDIKAQINKACDYSVDKVFEMARASRLARLHLQTHI